MTGKWIKERKEISEYPETEQQKKIAEAGKEIGKKCTGLKDKDFSLCRCTILEKFFPKKETGLQPSHSS